MSADKTEKPTPRRRREQIKKGNIPRSHELAQWGVVFLLTLFIGPLLSRLMNNWAEMMSQVFRSLSDPQPSVALKLLVQHIRDAFFTLVGLGSGILIVSVLVNSGQGGFHISTEKIKPDLKKLDVFTAARNMFKATKVWEMAKTIIKATIVGVIGYILAKSLVSYVGQLQAMTTVVAAAGDKAILVLRWVGATLLVVAGADYIIIRRQSEKNMKMSRQEVKDEARSSEGDPLIRSAIRRRQLEVARQRMFSAIPTADLILVNPTHFAIALKYDAAAGAPRVVAKGAGFIAQRIRTIGEENRLAVVQDAPLTRALYRSCDVGFEIPRELFAAVAQVLAYVITRRNKGQYGGEHDSPRTEESVPQVPLASVRRRRRPVVPEDPGTTNAPEDSAAGTTGR